MDYHTKRLLTAQRRIVKARDRLETVCKNYDKLKDIMIAKGVWEEACKELGWVTEHTSKEIV